MFEVNSSAGGFRIPTEIDPNKWIGELNKALTTGYALDPAAMTSIGPLRRQSLDDAIRTLPPSWKDYAATYNIMPKGPAASTVEEYTRITAFGGDHMFSGFVGEGEKGPEETGVFERTFTRIKYCSTTRRVTLQAMLVNSIAAAAVVENMNAVNFLISHVDRVMLFGKAALGVGGVDWYEFDGFDTQIPDTISGAFNTDRVIDAADSAMTYDIFENAAYKVAQYRIPAIPNTFIHSYATSGQLSKHIFNKITYFQPTNIETQAPLPIGALPNKGITAWGPMNFVRDYFIANWLESEPPSAATSSAAPTAPGAVTAASVANGAGRWNKYYSCSAHTFYTQYKVCACNGEGSSSPTTSNTLDCTAMGLTDTVRLTITNASPLTTAPTYFHIYRQDVYDGVASGFHPIARIPASSIAAGGTTTYDDICTRLPGRHVAFIGQLDPLTVQWRALQDLLIFDLPPLGPYKWWTLLMFGSLIWGAPERWVKIINISRTG